MRPRLHNTIAAVLLILSIGGHWAVLQSMAWAGMIYNYSQQAGVSAALKKTFDGKHPCQLCRFVTSGKKAEKKQDFSKSDLKVDLFLVASTPLLPAPTAFEQIYCTGLSDALIFHSPPTPPPRLA